MRKMLLSCVLTSLIGLAGLPASGAVRTHTVLVVYSNVQSLPADTQVDEKLRETLAVNTSLGLNYQTEYLDYPRYGEDNDRTYDKLVDDFLRAKYAGKSIDVIVAVGPEALLFFRSICGHTGSRHIREAGFL
jgi:hypothetical protein